MKKLLILAVLGLFMLGSMAYATETRVMTMGEVNNIVKDEANISIYPSTINFYPNLFIGEFSGSNYWKAGANWQFAQESNPIVIGTYFSQGEFEFPWIGFEGANEFIDHRIDLYGGMTMGEMPIGLNIRYFNSSNKNEDVDSYWNNEEQSMSYFRFGLGVTLMENKLDVSTYIGLTSWTDDSYEYWNRYWNPDSARFMYEDSGMVMQSEPAGNLDIGFNARYWMDPMGKYTLVPHLGFMISKRGADFYGILADDFDIDPGPPIDVEPIHYVWMLYGQNEDKTTRFDLGLGINYNAKEDVMIVGDFGIVMDKFKVQFEEVTEDFDPYTISYEIYETDFSTLVLPYFKLGIDAKVFKWMDLRSGVWTHWERGSYEGDFEGSYFGPPYDEIDEYSYTQKRSQSSAVTNTYLGAGFNWGDFTIDAQINTDFLQNGPYFISGDETDNLTHQVTVKYAF